MGLSFQKTFKVFLQDYKKNYRCFKDCEVLLRRSCIERLKLKAKIVGRFPMETSSKLKNQTARLHQKFAENYRHPKNLHNYAKPLDYKPNGFASNLPHFDRGLFKNL